MFRIVLSRIKTTSRTAHISRNSMTNFLVRCVPIYQIFFMVYEINELRAEVVRWRQVLIKYLSPRWADGLRQDILSNLYLNDYEDYDAYNFYVERYYRGENPMDNKKLSKRMRRLIEGKDKTSITYLE